MRWSAAWIGLRFWTTATGFRTRWLPASNESNVPTDAWEYVAVATRPTAPWDLRPTSAASSGSMTFNWLPVSTMRSNGPDWLTFTGMTSKAPATIRGWRLGTLAGQRASAWLAMDVIGNPAARTIGSVTGQCGKFISTSA